MFSPIFVRQILDGPRAHPLAPSLNEYSFMKTKKRHFFKVEPWHSLFWESLCEKSLSFNFSQHRTNYYSRYKSFFRVLYNFLCSQTQNELTKRSHILRLRFWILLHKTSIAHCFRKWQKRALLFQLGI